MRMNIAAITTYGVKCGIATYSAHLVHELSKGHDVMVFAEDIVDNALPQDEPGAKVRRCFSRTDSSPRLVEALASYPAEVVHIQHEYNIFDNLRDDLIRLGHEYRGRTILTLHTVYPSGMRKFDLAECGDCFIVHNDQSKRYLLEQFGIGADRVRTVAHGTLILTPIRQSMARLHLGLPLESKIILTHSFLERRKNTDKVLQAVADLQDELPIYFVHVGGDHPHGVLEDRVYARECLELPEKLGIESRVRMVNRFVPDVELGYYLSAADIIVVLEDTTYPELHASGIMHTVVPGKTVICSDIPEFLEFPDDAVYKIEISARALGDAIREILSHPDLGQRMADNLLRYARATSWDIVASQHAEIYGALMYSKVSKVFGGISVGLAQQYDNPRSFVSGFQSIAEA